MYGITFFSPLAGVCACGQQHHKLPKLARRAVGGKSIGVRRADLARWEDSNQDSTKTSSGRGVAPVGRGVEKARCSEKGCWPGGNHSAPAPPCTVGCCSHRCELFGPFHRQSLYPSRSTLLHSTHLLCNISLCSRKGGSEFCRQYQNCCQY